MKIVSHGISTQVACLYNADIIPTLPLLLLLYIPLETCFDVSTCSDIMDLEKRVDIDTDEIEKDVLEPNRACSQDIEPRMSACVQSDLSLG